MYFTALNITTLTALHYNTLHYITLHYTALNYLTLHFTTLHITTLHYITLHYITLHYIHCSTVEQAADLLITLALLRTLYSFHTSTSRGPTYLAIELSCIVQGLWIFIPKSTATTCLL